MENFILSTAALVFPIVTVAVAVLIFAKFDAVVCSDEAIAASVANRQRRRREMARLYYRRRR
jgi:hypothetical protein